MRHPTAIVAEDETAQRQALVRMLREEWPELDIVAECEDGLSTLEALQAHRPTVAFLDIRMPVLSGLRAASEAGGSTHIVFATAYSEHAVQAFEQGAADYLLKPISRERLRTTLTRLRQRISSGESPDMQQILTALRARSPEGQGPSMHWISTSVGNTVRMIPLEEILFFQSSDKYTRVVSRQGESVIRTALKELLASLDQQEFWQVHRGVIVRVASVRAMHALGGERYELELDGTAERVPVSVAFKGRFRGM
jgi:DNA-binding LytR/AlgR family response regulator